MRRVEEAFASLPERYLGADAGFDATFQIRLGDVGRTWEVARAGRALHVRTSATREPDVVIGTDAATWLGLREGRLSGLDAFAQRRLYARGDLDLALGFEGSSISRATGRPLLRVTDVEIPRRDDLGASSPATGPSRWSASTALARTRPRSSRRSRP